MQGQHPELPLPAGQLFSLCSCPGPAAGLCVSSFLPEHCLEPANCSWHREGGEPCLHTGGVLLSSTAAGVPDRGLSGSSSPAARELHSPLLPVLPKAVPGPAQGKGVCWDVPLAPEMLFPLLSSEHLWCLGWIPWQPVPCGGPLLCCCSWRAFLPLSRCHEVMPG